MNFKTSYLVFKLCLKLKEIYISKKFKNISNKEIYRIITEALDFINTNEKIQKKLDK